MKIKLAILAALVVAAVWAVVSNEPGQQAQSQRLDLKSEQSMARSESKDCIALHDLTPQHTPIELMRSVARCLEKENYHQAADLYTAAMTYGFYDTLRVSDNTAHQALMVVRMSAFSEAEQAELETLQDAIAARLEAPELCERLTALGAPQYHPDYMLQHGMEAFSAMPQEKGGLVADFDAAGAWQHALQTVPKCGAQ